MWTNLKQRTTTYEESSGNTKATTSNRIGKNKTKREEWRKKESVYENVRRHVANFSMTGNYNLWPQSKMKTLFIVLKIYIYNNKLFILRNTIAYLKLSKRVDINSSHTQKMVAM